MFLFDLLDEYTKDKIYKLAYRSSYNDVVKQVNNLTNLKNYYDNAFTGEFKYSLPYGGISYIFTKRMIKGYHDSLNRILNNDPQNFPFNFANRLIKEYGFYEEHKKDGTLIRHTHINPLTTHFLF